jgi:HEAT repeat protein
VIAFVLGRLAPEAEIGIRRKVVVALGRALRQDRDPKVRLWAARALVKFGPDGQAALADLRAALKDESEQVAEAAVNVLARLGHEGSVSLAEAFTDRSCKVRKDIARVLQHLGPGTPQVVPMLKKALDDEDPNIRYWAVEVLLRVDRSTGVRLGVPVLAQLLTDDRLLSGAFSSLAGLGPDAEAAIPALLGVLKSKNSKERDRAAFVLGRIGPAARSAVPALVEALDSGDEAIRSEAAWAITAIGPDVRDALPVFRNKLTKAKEVGRRVELATILGALGDTRQAIAVLMEVASSKEDQAVPDMVRIRALKALGKMGPKAASALPALRKIMRDKDDDVRFSVALAICQIGRHIDCGQFVIDEQYDGFEVFAEWIRRQEFVGYELNCVLDKLGADAVRLVPAVVTALEKEQSQYDRWLTLDALATLGPAAGEAGPALEALLKATPDTSDRIFIAATLVRIGRPRLAASVLPILMDRVARNNHEGLAYFCPHDAFDYLGFLGPEAKPAVPLLLQVMRHENYYRYLQAARALVAIDPQAAAKAGVYDPPR